MEIKEAGTTELITDVGGLDTSKQIVKYNQNLDCRSGAENDKNNDIDIEGFIKDKKDEVFDKMSKKSIERAEQYLDKLEGVIELEEESIDICVIFKVEEV